MIVSSRAKAEMTKKKYKNLLKNLISHSNFSIYQGSRTNILIVKEIQISYINLRLSKSSEWGTYFGPRKIIILLS
jgi:hypothetical protein